MTNVPHRSRFRSLSLVCLLSLTGCMTSMNTENLRGYRNPATEFRVHAPSVCHGVIWKTDTNCTLLVDDLFSSGNVLRLQFPARPVPSEKILATAQIVPKKNAPSPGGTAVQIEMIDGNFDTSNRIDDKMVFSHGLPTRLTLGVYWNLKQMGNNHVQYTVGYKYSPEPQQRFVTASCDAELPCMKRSPAATTGYCALYVLTVPFDIATAPFQALIYFLAPNSRN